ncbi:hypothetical protein KFE25_000972 [Diacronema lutheri]|uniref:Transmembrane protein n=1 Tax=Diacronema lutheri TaxID=2081491 RepID=A0A8J5X6T1_DIALT|nr:hypothetical protein KFE25_000972 [Diacronema lutheri]
MAGDDGAAVQHAFEQGTVYRQLMRPTVDDDTADADDIDDACDGAELGVVSSTAHAPARPRRAHAATDATLRKGDGGALASASLGGPDETGSSDSVTDDSDGSSHHHHGAHHGALTHGGINIFDPANRLFCAGYLAQYFAVGILYAGLPATCYGFFLGYLSVPAHTYSTVVVMTSLPWSFKLFFGVLNDTVPIRGQRRKPYMLLGWAFCAAMLLVLAMQPLPQPYWCIGDDGKYITRAETATGARVAAQPCNAEAAKSGGRFALLLILAATGYVVADVAADGLTVEYARAEPLARRGATQTTAYLTRSLGQSAASIVVGFGMNSHLYNGSFERGLSFTQVMALFAVPALFMVPITAALVVEPPAKSRPRSAREYAGACWQLVRGGAFFSVVLFSFFSPMVGNISTTAGGLVKRYWAGVQALQNQLFSLLGHLLFALGLLLVKQRCLHVSWRWLLALTTLGLNLLDLSFVGATTFNIVRNQYFYLGETVLYEVPAAAQFVVATYVIVEMADDGVEGLVYGMLTTAHNLSTPMARALGNQLYRLFQPSLSDASNYIEDSAPFRQTVFASFLVSFAFACSSLLFLGLLPAQKEQAQAWKRALPRRDTYALATLVLLGGALVYSLSVNFLSMHPDTMCLKFAGGDGCEKGS